MAYCEILQKEVDEKLVDAVDIASGRLVKASSRALSDFSAQYRLATEEEIKQVNNEEKESETATEEKEEEVDMEEIEEKAAEAVDEEAGEESEEKESETV